MNVSLSHQDAYYNAKLLEKKQTLPEDEIYLFGTMGSRMVMIQRTSSFLSRLWHLLLKIFGFLDTSSRVIERLTDATFMHRKSADYKKWALENGKITPLERKKWMEKHQGIKTTPERRGELELLSAREQSLMERIESDKVKIAALERLVVKLQSSEAAHDFKSKTDS